MRTILLAFIYFVGFVFSAPIEKESVEIGEVESSSSATSTAAIQGALDKKVPLQEPEETCVICHDTVQPSTKCPSSCFKCGHNQYHAQCIAENMGDKDTICPLCRDSLVKEPWFMDDLLRELESAIRDADHDAIQELLKHFDWSYHHIEEAMLVALQSGHSKIFEELFKKRANMHVDDKTEQRSILAKIYAAFPSNGMIRLPDGAFRFVPRISILRPEFLNFDGIPVSTYLFALKTSIKDDRKALVEKVVHILQIRPWLLKDRGPLRQMLYKMTDIDLLSKTTHVLGPLVNEDDWRAIWKKKIAKDSPDSILAFQNFLKESSIGSDSSDITDLVKRIIVKFSGSDLKKLLIFSYDVIVEAVRSLLEETKGLKGVEKEEKLKIVIEYLVQRAGKTREQVETDLGLDSSSDE